MDKKVKDRVLSWIKGVAAVAFWLLVWQLIVLYLDKKSGGFMGRNLLVASPAETVKTLLVMVKTTEFWKAVWGSFSKIASGFFYALAVGVLCAILAYASDVVRILLNPLLRLIKAVPVASFIILALFWLSTSENLSVLISFIMVLPVIYTNVLQGIESTDRELLEMAAVFRISPGKRIRYIYLPAVLPYFVSACSVGLGFCFKSGIAAEIIGLPSGSIGERMYEAKLYLLTEELFAWTAVILLISFVFEKAVMFTVRMLAKGVAGSIKNESEAIVEEKKPIETDGAKEDLLTEKIGQIVASPEGGLIQHRSQESDMAGAGDFGLFEVTKRFGDKTVLEHFSIALNPGEIVALMGASGCGKSTAGKLLLGLLKPDSGHVKRPGHMGAVFQEDRLCREFDAVTNISMVTGNRWEAVEALESVGLSGIVGKPVALLSGGMKRRIAIVRAMLSKGEVLVLDEPFTGLDGESKKKVMEFVKERARNRRVLFITHSLEEAGCMADRTVRMGMEARR